MAIDKKLQKALNEVLPNWYDPEKTVYTRDEWMANNQLSVWNSIPAHSENECFCEEPITVELWEQDWNTRGRIDTKICVKCHKVESWKIVR